MDFKDIDAKRAEDDFKMMTNPCSWSHMVLPLKKRGGSGEVGVLLGNKPTVYLVNIWELAGFLSKLEKGPKKEYDSYEEIVKDGWTVD